MVKWFLAFLFVKTVLSLNRNSLNETQKKSIAFDHIETPHVLYRAFISTPTNVETWFDSILNTFQCRTPGRHPSWRLYSVEAHELLAEDYHTISSTGNYKYGLKHNPFN